jgi:hypothetical protein
MDEKEMIKKVKLESKISDILLEFLEAAKEDLTTSDLQGIAMAKAMDIIRIIKEA